MFEIDINDENTKPIISTFTPTPSQTKKAMAESIRSFAKKEMKVSSNVSLCEEVGQLVLKLVKQRRRWNTVDGRSC